MIKKNAKCCKSIWLSSDVEGWEGPRNIHPLYLDLQGHPRHERPWHVLEIGTVLWLEPGFYVKFETQVMSSCDEHCAICKDSRFHLTEVGSYWRVIRRGVVWRWLQWSLNKWWFEQETGQRRQNMRLLGITLQWGFPGNPIYNILWYSGTSHPLLTAVLTPPHTTYYH